MQEHDSSKRNNSGDDFPENFGRSFKEIGKRIKRKSRRPPLSPDNEVQTNNTFSIRDYLSDDDTQMGFTENQSTENETTENPPAKEEVLEKIKRTKPYRKTGFTKKQATENEPTANPPTKEVAKKIKKTKFCRKKTEKKKKAVIRNPPRLFSEMVYYLSDVQKTWVIKSGFESLLGFDLEMIPSKLASKVVEAFDHTSVPIGIENGRIYITEEDVFNAIGLPNGGKTIEHKSTEVTDRRHTEWLAQFPNKLITTARVVEKVKEETRLTELFKINFLTVLSNVLIGTPTHSYVDTFFTKFEELDKFVSYNWAKF
ncbi:hypothetical protein POM88_018265 [Heracleum sosnowskyi]|uniref:Uncharacterized protein n=1 Tax=Heracleum sosnowskyi TaxID=360622 RepID=A0AAD8ITD5_9APIA|nr:hypothetical protein POM88_018265 [Heracleum sosnowskyi]